jgi:E3 ubiquitin-protein ligase HERC2
VLPSVSSPKYGWGSVTYSSVGTVTAVGSSSITVDFPEQSGWTAAVGELLVVCASGSGSSSGCSAESYMDGGSSARCRSCPAGERARSSAEDVLWMCLFEY